MKINEQLRFIVINEQADSLYSLIADGQYRETSLRRDTWKTLIGAAASLQNKCNKEGFNAFCTLASSSKARIGIVSNQEDECLTCDSRGSDLGLEATQMIRTCAVTWQNTIQIME